MIKQRVYSNDIVAASGECCVCGNSFNTTVKSEDIYNANFCSDNCKKYFDKMLDTHLVYNLRENRDLTFLTSEDPEITAFVKDPEGILYEVDGGAKFLMMLLADYYKHYEKKANAGEQIEKRCIDCASYHYLNDQSYHCYAQMPKQTPYVFCGDPTKIVSCQFFKRKEGE